MNKGESKVLFWKVHSVLSSWLLVLASCLCRWHPLRKEKQKKSFLLLVAWKTLVKPSIRNMNFLPPFPPGNGVSWWTAEIRQWAFASTGLTNFANVNCNQLKKPQNFSRSSQTSLNLNVSKIEIKLNQIKWEKSRSLSIATCFHSTQVPA